MDDRNCIQSVERVFNLIELLCENGQMGITELSNASGLHKTTIHRFINSLCVLGYAEKCEDNEKYRLTLKFLKISAAMLASTDIRKNARPVLERLPSLTGETVHLVERCGNDIVYIDKFESYTNSVRMVSRIGLSLPMIYTAVGKAILATLDDSEIKSIWDGTAIIAKTPKTITNFSVFMSEISKVRENGYAVDDEENELGVRCVAAAIPDIDGHCRYAFSVSAPISRMDKEKLTATAETVLKCKEEITK